jgi:hypothetical protein
MPEESGRADVIGMRFLAARDDIVPSVLLLRGRCMTQAPPRASDLDLLNRFMADDPTGLDALANRYDEKLAAFLLFLVGDRRAADELLDNLWTDVYLPKGHGGRPKDPNRGSVEGYLYALAGHLAREWLTAMEE